MRAWIQDVLGQVKSTQQLQSVLHDLCRPYGEVVTTDIDLADSRQVTCKIRMADRPAAKSAADWLGAKVPESDLIVLEYQASTEFKS